MSTLKSIGRKTDEWGDYCRIAADAFTANPDTQDRWNPDLDEHRHQEEYFLFFNDGCKPVGILNAMHSDYDFVHLSAIAILAEERGKHLGHEMLRAFEAVAGGRYETIWLDCKKDMAGFYEQVGYAVTASEPHKQDYVVMAKKLVR